MILLTTHNTYFRLKETEELLRVSINECLTLKHKLQKEKIHRATDVAQFRQELQDKLEKVADFDELETAVKEVISSTHSFKNTEKISKGSSARRQIYSSESDDSETAVKAVSSRGKRFEDSETAVKGVSSRGQKFGDSETAVKGVSSRGQKFDNSETATKRVYSRGRKFDDSETAAKRIYSRGQESDDDSETAVKGFSSVRSSKRVDGPFECMYCKQGSEHKLCDEKIRELRAKNRKLSTELKVRSTEMFYFIIYKMIV